MATRVNAPVTASAYYVGPSGNSAYASVPSTGDDERSRE
jgi:hypothetical protein